ncbi:MAG: hypothetical protein AB9856_20920 [Cellulosilyticaceae bacterium]
MEKVAVAVTLLGLTLTLLNIWDRIYTNRSRIKQEGGQEQAMQSAIKTMQSTIETTQSVLQSTQGAMQVTQSDIGAIRQGNASILVQLDKMDTKMDNYQERLVRVEESAKSAHKRIDSLEQKHV